MTQYIKKLPAVFQTVTEKKFFDATFDQVFSKKDSDLLYGYLGQRNPGYYNPVSDFYIPEPTKNRTWWQLEATAFARNADSTKSNVFFYDDLLNRINYYGGNTLNQDRLFESEYYSWAPPIDFDMFINYQNYYWVDQGLVSIPISGVLASDINGQTSYTTPLTATPPNLTLTTGMGILLLDDPVNTKALVVENMGGCIGIKLVEQSPDYIVGTILEFLPWDGTIQLNNGRVITNTNWDTLTWDVQPQPGNGDYITIERGAIDKNAWSKSNKWFHIDAINATIAATGTAFPATASRALRPIIQFSADLPLFNSGTQFKADIAYGLRNDILGNPLLLADWNAGLTTAYIDSQLSIELQTGQLVAFLEDPSANQNIFTVDINTTTNIVTFVQSSTIVDGDILFATLNAPFDGMRRGQTWYYDTNQWVHAANDKITTNQPPLFQLYDHNGVSLSDDITYPSSTFAGNKIFSYKVNTAPGATVDPVLKFPIVYTSLGQSSDIMFQNNLMVDRYTFGTADAPIAGYYYYKTTQSPVMFNDWNLYTPCDCNSIVPPPPFNCISTSKQRVIDKFVVGYGTQYQFKLSVTPYGYPTSPDLVVSVNGFEVKNATLQTNGYVFSVINNSIYVDLQDYLTSLLTVTQPQPPVVEIDTYTHGLLDPSAPGYFQIPQQLEANPSQLEVSEISASNLIQQFSSIIENQIGFTGSSFGGNNNYRDTRKNRSVGSYILQNIAPALKSMLISSEDDLDFISGVRFSQDEYTKFKNKYLRTAQQLINQEFSPVQYHNNTVIISAWVDAIIKTVNVSKEFSSAFAYSYMIANGAPYQSETATVPPTGIVSLSSYLDLSDSKNALYVYDTAGNERLLLIGVDYEISSSNLSIELEFSSLLIGSTVYIALYRNPLPAYIPSTPAKVGASGVFVPRMELDYSYTVPTQVIIGHDGSKTVAYNDYRDALLLELETRVYNLLHYKFRNEYHLPLRLEDIKSGYFRQTRYTRNEYLEITQSYLNKWSAKNKANYRVNDWAYASAELPTNSPELWKLYNYTDATVGIVPPVGEPAYLLPGNWKGIFQFYFDTIYPDTRPWEMLGFTSMPSWWVSEYTSDWSSSNTALWADLEAGIIRQGPSAIFDSVTLIPQPQLKWARPGLSNIIPVDALGNIVPVPTLFNIAIADLYAPFDGFDKPWVYGDGGPVEQAWMSTSGYAFSVQEFLYLMKPGPFGELFFDTVGTELTPGTTSVPGVYGPVMTTANWQYVQNDVYTSTDPQFTWMRPKNKDQVVHAEIIDNVINIRYGYQRWISDRILFLGKDVGDVFGQKVRTLDVNLANKLAGFTNKDTTSVYIESVSTSATTTSLLIPTNNFEVILHKSQPIKTYAYSGVIIRALSDGTFAVYGYDLLNSEFIVLNRSEAQLIDITIGGTPADFKIYAIGEIYYAGDIVRYNGVYYLSIGTIEAGKFDIKNWQKLRALPTVGGVSVTYKPISETTSVRIPYGTVLSSVQEVFDLLIGWGAYLETQGWKFTDVSADTNQVSDWLYSAKQFLFWLNTNWAPDSSIQVSPAANNVMLTVQGGYPSDVESISNGVYSILDKYGVAIPPDSTTTDRDGMSISVAPADLSVGGIYFLQVNATEAEHVLIFDNSTSFSDVIYSPLLRARQQRLRFNGFRSNGWYGKQEAPGYLIIDDQLVPNYDTIVDSMRYFYDPDVTIDNPSLENLGRHLIGYDSKSYLDNLQLSNDTQYLFYQGAIRQKGTTQAFDKLFRSTQVQGNETIEVYEEWALKLGNFGNTIEQVSTEFKLKPEQNAGEVIVARLNFIPSNVGFVKEVNIFNAENRYTSVPKIIIAPPDATPDEIYDTKNWQTFPWDVAPVLRQATAYAVLDSTGVISRIDIIDPGFGYTSAPFVYIDSGTQPHDLDSLYAVWQGAITRDEAIDNIIDIDIDDTDTWAVRPIDPSYSLEFPTTDVIEYVTPNAGYVNFNDVTWSSFNVSQTAVKWGTPAFNPVENDTVWVAKTFTEDWDVYKMVNINTSPMAANPWKIIEDDSGNLLLLTNLTTKIVPQFSDVGGDRTDFGNMICLQSALGGIVAEGTNYAVTIAPSAGSSTTDPWESPVIYTDPETLTDYYSYDLLTLDGTPITSADMGDYNLLTDLLLFKTMRWQEQPTEPLLPVYVGINDLIWVDNIDNKWAVVKITADPGKWDITLWDPAVGKFWGVPYTHDYGWDISGPFYFTPYRVQEKLIDSKLFENSQVFQTKPETELVLLPIYDPFKGILPASAKQNISYMLLQDPAKYNVTGNTRLFSENIVFADAQVGRLWWDLSEVKYVYYEQPALLDGSESPTDNLVYRRDRWGQLFPGSSINIYEWTKSPVPPSQYTGTGIPRSTTDYVQLATTNRFTNITTVSYYFWVLNATDKPNIENRTLAASEVARLLATPKSQGLTFFAPIQQTAINNSYMFYNVQDILAYKGNNVQIQYRLAARDDQEHTQWMFFREGDTGSLVTPQYWNKMVDSLCGYTALLPDSDEWTNGIRVSQNLPSNTLNWNVAPWLDTTLTEVQGEVLPVPDPALSGAEKYGIDYRPRQSMFVDVYAARKIFVQSSNNLLKHIPIRDNNLSWNTGVETNTYWTYTNWYEVGFEDITPDVVFSTIAEAQAALSLGKLTNGTIVEIVDGTVDGRFVLYNVTQPNANIQTQSLQKVGIELSAIKLLDTIYTVKHVYKLSTELRQLLNAFRTEVFVDSYLVDQNELYFSMLNYVVSEQKNPNWTFKTSYIYIKENNIPLTQTSLYIPDQIDNIISYIVDSKPYHTQIRDYTSTYLSSDIAVGTASDSMASKTILQFGPDFGGPYEAVAVSYNLSAQEISDNIAQLVSGGQPLSQDVYTIPLTTFDPSKIGYSQLFPYTFSLSTLNDPQSFITPADVVSIIIGSTVLTYGRDYYVGINLGDTYTVYFYEDPGTVDTPLAVVLWDAGSIVRFNENIDRKEVASGTAIDDFVVNVDTKLPAYDVSGIPSLAPAMVSPYVGWGDTWEAVTGDLAQALIDANGTPEIPWDTTGDLVILQNTVSYKEHTNVRNGDKFYRNANGLGGELVSGIVSTSDTMQVSAAIDIFPVNGTLWINGEQIRYNTKTVVSLNVWELAGVQRGVDGTAIIAHTAGSKVFIISTNSMPSVSANNVWNALTLPAGVNTATETEAGKFTSISNAALGGIWYSTTSPATFLKAEQGDAVP